ncbi:hypothetical protein BLKGLAD_51090 [Burkholderia gladioli pv. gladioli]|jgi:hypothetical protein
MNRHYARDIALEQKKPAIPIIRENAMLKFGPIPP